ncbi:leukocyte surface antigen CD53-like isoform X1 [Mytilus edulis]|uniref:leukocyte surface antigen CD53-like isoform X1 n=1 Tax=Mytilus edulis TaxID=6550 RepID=UPI0039EF173A
MCWSEKVSKILLIVLNILFMLLGLGILIPGLLMILNVDIINDKILPLMQQVSIGTSNLGDLAQGLSITLIVLGGFVLIVATFGACGACCQNKVCLIVYAIAVGILFVGKLVIVILWFVMNDTIVNSLKSELKSALLNKYSHDDLTSSEVSTSWNYLFIKLECCGVDAVTSATNDFDSTSWQTGSPNTDIPLGCCPGVTIESYLSASATNAGCPSSSGSAPVGQYSKGCYDAVYDLIRSYTIAFIVFLVIILLVEIATIASALIICKRANKDQIV